MLYFLGKYILLWPFIGLFLRPKVLGWNNLKFKGGAIIISNHWSLPDPVFLAVICPRWIHFMAKKEIFATGIGRLFFGKLLLAFPVDRKKPDIKSVKYAMELLREGKVFGIFPEGRRSTTRRMDRFEKGAAFLALKAGVPVIPVYSDPYGLKKWKLRYAVGEAIDPVKATEGREGKPVDVLTEILEDRMQQLRKSLEEQD